MEPSLSNGMIHTAGFDIYQTEGGTVDTSTTAQRCLCAVYRALVPSPPGQNRQTDRQKNRRQTTEGGERESESGREWGERLPPSPSPSPKSPSLQKELLLSNGRQEKRLELLAAVQKADVSFLNLLKRS